MGPGVGPTHLFLGSNGVFSNNHGKWWGTFLKNISLYLLVMAICCSQKLVETLAALAKFDKHSTKHGTLTSSYQDRTRFNPWKRWDSDEGNGILERARQNLKGGSQNGLSLRRKPCFKTTFLSWCHVNLVSRTPFWHFNIEIEIVQGSMSGNVKTKFFAKAEQHWCCETNWSDMVLKRSWLLRDSGLCIPYSYQNRPCWKR